MERQGIGSKKKLRVNVKDLVIFLNLYIDICTGLDSTFGGLEAMITGLCDEYPRLLGCHRELFVLGLLFFIYICALPTTTYVSLSFIVFSEGKSTVTFVNGKLVLNSRVL